MEQGPVPKEAGMMVCMNRGRVDSVVQRIKKGRNKLDGQARGRSTSQEWESKPTWRE